MTEHFIISAILLHLWIMSLRSGVCRGLCGGLLVAAAPLQRRGAPSLVIPRFRVNIHFRGERKDLDLIRDGGFKFIR